MITIIIRKRIRREFQSREIDLTRSYCVSGILYTQGNVTAVTLYYYYYAPNLSYEYRCRLQLCTGHCGRRASLAPKYNIIIYYPTRHQYKTVCMYIPRCSMAIVIIYEIIIRVVCASAKTTHIIIIMYVFFFHSSGNFDRGAQKSRRFFCFLFLSYPGLSERQICWRFRGGSCDRGGHCPAIFRIIIPTSCV